MDLGGVFFLLESKGSFCKAPQSAAQSYLAVTLLECIPECKFNKTNYQQQTTKNGKQPVYVVCSVWLWVFSPSSLNLFLHINSLLSVLCHYWEGVCSSSQTLFSSSPLAAVIGPLNDLHGRNKGAQTHTPRFYPPMYPCLFHG